MRHFPSLSLVFSLLLMATLLTVACGGSTPEPAAPPPAAPATSAPAAVATEAPPAATSAPAATTASAPVAPTGAPAAAPTEAMAATEAPAASPTEAPAMEPGATVFNLGEGTIARYRVEEELARTGFFVAVGETTDVEGRITFDADGAVVADESRITVQAATLQTDSNRRDGYVRSRTLETDTYPEVVFQPTSIDGLPESLADASGPVDIVIDGNLTVKDQTRPVTWNGTAEFAGDGTASGSVAVEFTFEEFGMDKPSVAIVLSVDDTIRLELDFAGTVTGP